MAEVTVVPGTDEAVDLPEGIVRSRFEEEDEEWESGDDSWDGEEEEDDDWDEDEEDDEDWEDDEDEEWEEEAEEWQEGGGEEDY